MYSTRILVLITIAIHSATLVAAMRPHKDLNKLCIEAKDIVLCEVGHMGEKGYIEAQKLVIESVWKGNRKIGDKVLTPAPFDFRFFCRLDADNLESEIAFPIVKKLFLFLESANDDEKDPILCNGVIAIDSDGAVYTMEQQLWNPSPYSLSMSMEGHLIEEKEFLKKLTQSLLGVKKSGLQNGLQE